MNGISSESFGNCPVPHSQYEHILLGHGSGGRMTAELIERLFVPAFGDDVLARLEDQAVVPLSADGNADAPRLAFTTDSFVVRPIFFPGGDIGRPAVQRDGQRPGGRRGDAAVSERGVHP
jgi:hydrogenase expression/formation protein HypE